MASADVPDMTSTGNPSVAANRFMLGATSRPGPTGPGAGADIVAVCAGGVAAAFGSVTADICCSVHLASCAGSGWDCGALGGVALASADLGSCALGSGGLASGGLASGVLAVGLGDVAFSGASGFSAFGSG